MRQRTSGHRPEQVAEIIRGVVANALAGGEIRDPRVGLVTVNQVTVTRDLSHATVSLSPHGTPEEKQAAIEALQGATAWFRRLVAKSLSTRVVPELHLELDRGQEYAKEINRLLADLRTGESGN